MRVLWPLRIDKIGVKQRILYSMKFQDISPAHQSEKSSLIVRKQQCIKRKLNHLS